MKPSSGGRTPGSARDALVPLFSQGTARPLPSTSRPDAQHRKDSGFALLLVFLMAACVAIMLYMEMPRVAFEAERQKELLLIDRGNQFKRAIQVFVKDTKGNPTGNYPASIDQLENFNNRRYLRRKYVDPMTGKDEWRLIHFGGVPGQFPDSVATQKPTQNAAAGSTGGLFSNTLQSFDAPSSQQQGGVNMAMRRRPSDGGTPGGSDSGASSAGGSQGNNGNAGGGTSGSTGSLPGQGAPSGGGRSGGGTGSGGTGGTGGAGSQPCMAYIGNTCVSSPGPAGGNGTPGGIPPGQPGAPPTGVPGGMPGAPPTGVPGAPPGGFPGSLPGLNGQPAQAGQPNQAQSAAAGIIQGILTSPRPGGMPTTTSGTMVGGGIAGVASKYEAEGIMVINDRTAINEWEYIFDTTKYVPPVNPLAGGPGTPANGSPAGAPGALTPGGGLGGAGGIGNMNGGGSGPVINGPGRGGGQ